MIVIFTIFLLIFTLYLIEFVLINFLFDKKFIKSVNSLKIKNIKFPFNNSNNTALIYIPSPNTNWTLNPYYKNPSNEFIHYREGFRKTCKLNSIVDKIQNNRRKTILLGSSTTYCSDIFSNELTWPFLVQKKFEKTHEIFNFGVPHFILSQTLIRLVNWINLIKPELVILYQAKNDMNYISNIPDGLKYIQNDFENIQSQFSASLINILPKKINLPFFRLKYLKNLKNINFDILYDTKADIERLNNNDLSRINSSIVNKTLSIASICNNFGIQFIYIPEIVTKGIHREILNHKIYPIIRNDLSQFDNCEYFDINEIMPITSNYYLDKMHFNQNGCKVFSEIIISKINNIYG